MKNYFFKMNRLDYQIKIIGIIDKALNDLSSEDFDILIEIIKDYINDLN